MHSDEQQLTAEDIAALAVIFDLLAQFDAEQMAAPPPNSLDETLD